MSFHTPAHKQPNKRADKTQFRVEYSLLGLRRSVTFDKLSEAQQLVDSLSAERRSPILSVVEVQS